jgi:hypothetical protein
MRSQHTNYFAINDNNKKMRIKVRPTQLIKMGGKICVQPNRLSVSNLKSFTGIISWWILLMAHERQKANGRARQTKRAIHGRASIRKIKKKHRPFVLFISIDAAAKRVAGNFRLQPQAASHARTLDIQYLLLINKNREDANVFIIV